VKYKKVDGTLRLIKNKISWIQKEESTPKIEIFYSDIKVQRISPDSSSKVQLQIMLHSEKSFNFHFASPKGRDHQFKQRDEVKNLLAQLIPAHRNKVNREIEEKSKMLKENPELYQLYKDLVIGGIITSDEFWENRNLNSSTQFNGSKQETGISSGFLAEIRPDMHGCNELRFNITADSIQAIFKTYPAVQRKYESSVPHEISEEEFWKDFFRSRHFHRDRYASSKGSKDVFGECAEKDELQQLQESLQKILDPTLDLTDTDASVEEGYGLGWNQPQQTSGAPLIRKFNHQSLMVLKNSSKRQLESEEIIDDQKRLEKKKMKLKESTGYDDLEAHEIDEVYRLKLLDADKFAHGFMKNGSKMDVESSNQTLLGDFAKLKDEVLNWQPDLTRVLTSENACAALSEISPGSKLANLHAKSNISNQISPQLQSEWRQQYIALSELLRHFWSCFPVRTPQLEEKLMRMASCIEKFRDTKLSDFKQRIGPENIHLVTHIVEQIDTTLKKFATWQEKRTQR